MNPATEQKTEEGGTEKEAQAPVAEAPVFQAVLDENESDEAESQMRRMSRRSFLWALGAGVGTLAGYKWIDTRRADGGIPWPLRRVLDTQGEIARDLFATARLAPTFPASLAKEPRANGNYGLESELDLASWNLNVSGLHSGEDLQLSLADIKKLPRTEIVTELKCIEGWSVVVRWAGVKISDFMRRYPPATQSGDAPNLDKKPRDLLPYVSAQTPDGAYFVGLDIESVLQPQTLLCYEMNGQALTPEHGAPLRLVTPTKYGIKHLKRLGTLEFTGQKPEDFWAQRGYDWYSGH
ncbi:Oxidoreductase molybdopterin binding domain-containing protein [Abditibacterium utsteinense]|uniref:Oxidoreductase molybdopterin binding domain-containing protein n=1 Tax=Abditibacterium utsteinense TaxID=1960156 RepID=A0A2S8SQK5_9BACT|nr:molybdopterin-dependent oxidoreductase [Abditibacterium utsteinense]PQV63029.1 Oxidoreductase molybdopterin binding domain-containing protein [Abditibacterium utsteinense]